LKKETQTEIKQTNDDTLLPHFKYLLDFYFGEVSLETIQSLNPHEKGLFNFDAIEAICEQIGLIALKKEINACDIPNHFLPCIIFNKEQEPVIYQKNIAHKKIELYDVASKKSFEVTHAQLKQYTQALLVFREANKKELLDKQSDNNWFWQPVKSFWKSYVEVGVLTFFINIFALFVPLFIMIVYDRVVPNQAYETLFVLSFGLIIVLIFELIFKTARTHIIDKTGQKLSLFLEEDLMKRLLTLQSQYDTMMTGSKANLFRELSTVRDFFATKSIVQVIDFPFFIFALIVIYFISPAVALVPFFIAIVVVVMNIILQVPISNLSKKHLENTQAKHNYLVESIQGSDTVKLSNATANKLFSWRNIIAFAENIQVKIQSVNAFALNMSQSLIQLTTILVVTVGVFQIADKELSVGGLIAVTILASRAMVPVISLSTMVIKFKEIKDSLNNLKEFWNTPLENEKNIEIGLGKLKGDIEFKNVTYYFKNAKYPSVNNINLHIKNGEKVGIIGQTGAGKSTILKLITTLLHPTKGTIFIDNHDTATIHPVEIRQNIGVMTQEPFLFNGTLKENIELSRPMSKERLMDIITLTGLEDLVKKSGQGDGMIVGERGCNLSVGQRHLVGLARSIVHDPSILILDEPTTGLDVGLEKKLMHSLKEIVKDKTLILITHRFAALELVDRIVVLNEGKIVANGPRDAVLQALKSPQGKK
jgi:ATP-binding cassette subfamily B protein/ATP-binding cassette subfamily C protein LapB